MSDAEKKRQKSVLELIISLVVVLLGSIIFMGLVSGWFGDGGRMMLSAEYYCQNECDGELMSLSVEKYNELVRENKTFVVFINQDGCTTADRLRGYITDYSREAGIKAYQMMFSDMKETNLHETIKYYPSVAVISHGKVVSYLRADSDEDADYYNDYEAFKKWMNKNVVLQRKTD